VRIPGSTACAAAGSASSDPDARRKMNNDFAMDASSAVFE
jgi:hypothetical protein